MHNFESLELQALIPLTSGSGPGSASGSKRVTLVYLYHVNRCGHRRKLSIAKLDFVQVCGLSLNFYNNIPLCKFYKFSDSQET